MAALNQMDINKLRHRGYDLNFISKTQPQGNLKIHSGYIENDSGFMTFVNVYKFPKNNLPAFWLSGLANQKHVIALLSVGNQNLEDVRPEVNRSIDELESQMNDPKLQPSEQISAGEKNQALLNFEARMNQGSETLKKVTLRLLVYAPTLQKLMHRVQVLKDKFYAFPMGRFIDEQEYDLRSVYLPITQQEKMPNKRPGTIMQSYDLGGSYMFNYVNLTDPGGRYFGFTQTRGAFMFNPFDFRDPDRNRDFSLVSGNSGMGKSTLLQMLNDDAFLRGDFIRNFDVTGEYRQSTKTQHGIILDTSQNGNRVNMFEIFPTVTDENGNVDEVDSFNQNISKIMAIVHILNSGIGTDELNLLSSCLTDFYHRRGMWPKNPQAHPNEIKVIGLPHEQYPTISEFMIYLSNKKDEINSEAHPSQQDLISIKRLYFAFKNMNDRYGAMFNGHTNIQNFDKERVVDFDMTNAKHASAGVENQLFQAQFFSYLSMVSAQMIENGEKYRRKKKEHTIVDDKLGYNIPFYYINIDEAENYFNPRYPEVVSMLADMMEEMRKNYCAITFASPTLKDILRNDGVQSNDKNYEDYEDSVKRIFTQFQYFHLFRLDGADITDLKKFFSNDRQHNSVSPEQLDTLPELHHYQLLTIIVGERSYRWQTELSDAQLERYQ